MDMPPAKSRYLPEGEPDIAAFAHRVYVTPRKFAEMNHLKTVKSVYRAVRDGRIDGVVRIAGTILIPKDAVLRDRRIKTGRMIGWRIRNKAIERD